MLSCLTDAFGEDHVEFAKIAGRFLESGWRVSIERMLGGDTLCLTFQAPEHLEHDDASAQAIELAGEWWGEFYGIDEP